MEVGIHLETTIIYFLMSLSVPYQLKLGVERLIQGRWTLASCAYKVQYKEHSMTECFPSTLVILTT